MFRIQDIHHQFEDVYKLENINMTGDRIWHKYKMQKCGYKYKMQCLFNIFLINILFCNFLLVQDWPIERNLQQCMKNSAEKNH